MEIKPTKKLKQNQRQEERREDSTGYEACRKILGSGQSVLDFGLFYDGNQDEIAMVLESKLIDFCTNENFDSDNYKFYKKGLIELADFFRSCSIEKQGYKTNLGSE